MATVTVSRTYTTGSQLTASNYNDDRSEIIAGVNNIDNTQIITGADIAPSKIAGTAATLTGSETLTNKTLTSPTLNTPTINTATIATATINTSTLNSPTIATPTLTGLATFGTWSSTTQPRTRVSLSGTQSITSGVTTAISFSSEDFDVGPMHDTSTNPSRITIPATQGGIYLVGGSINLNTALTATRVLVSITKNGSSDSELLDQTITTPVADGTISLSSQIVSVNAGDYIEITFLHNLGSAVLIGINTKFWAVKLA